LQKGKRVGKIKPKFKTKLKILMGKRDDRSFTINVKYLKIVRHFYYFQFRNYIPIEKRLGVGLFKFV
jgi:hypothetical protein